MVTHAQKAIRLRLQQDQMDLLQTIALQQGVSAEELVRESVVEMLTKQQAKQAVQALPEPEAWPEDRPIEEHPAWVIVGMFDSGLTDLSENHDKYLAEIFEEEQRRYLAECEMERKGQWPEKSS